METVTASGISGQFHDTKEAAPALGFKASFAPTDFLYRFHVEGGEVAEQMMDMVDGTPYL